MKRYYYAGKEITPKEYDQVQIDNKRALELAEKTGDLGYMWQCKIVTVWDDGRPERTEAKDA